MRSAIAPPYSPAAISGTSSTAAEQAGQEGRAGLRVELVGQRDERRLRPQPGQELARSSRRRSRDARSGAISTATRRTAALSFRDRRTRAPCLAGYDGELADRGPGRRRAAGYHAASVQPSAEQLEAYARDGFLVVERWLEPDEVERLRERFHRCFAHEWETGLQPDEVNYDPATTPPDLTRQLCNVWKADRTIAATVLAARIGSFARALASAPGLRLIQDNMIWKPPSGKALLCHQDAAYLAFLDPPNMTTCWMALDDTRADTGTIFYVRGSHPWPRAARGGTFHAPEDWLGHVRESLPGGRRARARADRGARRRRGLPRRLDVPRQPAERARGRASAAP